MVDEYRRLHDERESAQAYCQAIGYSSYQFKSSQNGEKRTTARFRNGSWFADRDRSYINEITCSIPCSF